MTDKEYIEREALLERIDGIWDCADMVFEPNDHCCRADDCASCKWRETKNAIRKIAAYLPAADVRPVRRGKWILYQDRDSTGKFEYVQWSCSACKSNVRTGQPRFDSTLRERPRFNFCPNCGAWMEES